jgi:hypothetical protein
MNAARRLLVLSYDPEKPSFRYRIAPLLTQLRERGWSCDVDRLPQRQYGWRIWSRRKALRSAGAVLLHKLRLEPWEMRWLSTCNPRTLFDVDDATWLSQPKLHGAEPIASAHRQRAFEALCEGAVVTMVGNEFLARHAKAAGARVELLPTAVDVAAYGPTNFTGRRGATAVWIGLPGNLQYLEPLRPVFATLSRERADFRLRVISSRFPDWPDVRLESVLWQPGIETRALADADIGLMPLADDAFTRGKCAFKLLQYMAASLPCIASPVGANRDVVLEGETGLFADGPQDWRSALLQLLDDAALRERMSIAGRLRVAQRYDLAVIAPAAASCVERVAFGRVGTSTTSSSDA